MNERDIKRILKENDRVRLAGTAEEAACAQYFADACTSMGLCVQTEVFSLPVWREEESSFTVNGKSIPCRGRLGSPNASAAAPLYYLSGSSEADLKKCKGRIVLTERAVGYSLYDRLISHGAVGIVGTCGNLLDSTPEIDSRPIYFSIPEDSRIPWVTVHISEALACVRAGLGEATLCTRQECLEGSSQNVVAELAGETEETVVISAHYDSTSLSRGAYDNLSGCIGLLYLAELLSGRKLRRGVRLLWCGAEERGLLGSLAYCEAHAEERTVLNVNLDMLGSVMGEFSAFSCADEATANFLEKFASRRRFPLSARHGIRSSDSNSFVHAGIPAVSFARYSPASVVQIHTPTDTPDAVSPRQLLCDMNFIAGFVLHAVNDPAFVDSLSIAPSIAEEVSSYFKRKLLKK